MSFAFFTVCIYFNNVSNPNSPLSMNSLHISTKSLPADRFKSSELYQIKIGSPDILYSLVINVGNSFTILRVCVSLLHHDVDILVLSTPMVQVLSSTFGQLGQLSQLFCPHPWFNFVQLGKLAQPHISHLGCIKDSISSFCPLSSCPNLTFNSSL